MQIHTNAPNNVIKKFIYLYFRCEDSTTLISHQT
jgi:hypothetical protein